MAFNLYFAGSQCKEADELMVKLNCNRLFSQENDRKNISNWQNYKHSRRTQYKGNIFIDSGAFSVHTKGIELDVDEYIEYINSIDKDIHIFAQVDKIPGEFGKQKTKEQILEAPALSWKNYLYMKDRVNSRDKLLPIFHQGEDFKWLHNILEYTHDDGSHISYIGISPANDKSAKEKEIFIHKCFNIIKKSSNPNVKTHAFGMTSRWILEQYPFTSADSTSWLMTGANGSIMTPYGIILVSQNKLNDPSHINNMPIKARENVEQFVEKLGYQLEEAMIDYKIRMCINISYLKQWADNYEYKPIKTFKKSLF